LLIATTATLWVRQLRHCRAMSKPEAPVASKLGVRAVRAAAVVLAFGVGFGVWFTWSAQASALPDRFSMLAHENVDYGGGPEVGHGTVTGHSHGGHDGSGDGQAVSVTELTGPRKGEPDRRFTLTAQEAQVKLASGKTVDAWTFDGQAPGPELRVRQGDLVEVTLLNEDIEDGLAIHWHGLDVPNAEDGVVGVTQDAVRPGETHTYRFRAEQVGTYWYHSHQVSSKQVKKGLFGALVVLPEDYDESEVEDITVAAHRWPGEQEFATIATTFGTSDTLDRRSVSPGTRVQLRLINTDSYPMRFTLSGTPFQVAAIDGTDINGPTDITGQTLPVAAGGRYDITFTMPETPVALGLNNRSGPGILFSRDGSGEVPAAEPGPEFDPTTYGTPEPTPFSPSSTFDREFVQVFDNIPGFYDGQFTYLWATNGEVFPDTPTLMVREGDLVKVTFVNRSFMDHPMHPHGHHMLVLSRNGRPVTGSPWWTDTLNVAPGETYEVAFKADNPGIWMDHCHNLDHAAAGMMMHLGYEGVTTPFEVGDATGNHPE
jgi:FtsP/CotA-like multicopper oxidase with cupredoxin domain